MMVGSELAVVVSGLEIWVAIPVFDVTSFIEKLE
jgi:hypothetical protein